MANVWELENWRKTYDIYEVKNRSGLRLRCDKFIDQEVKRACKEFCQWLRKEYYFPIRVPIYLKYVSRIRAMDGDLVSATFFGPFNKYLEPYIRIAAGDYEDLLKNCDKDNALSAYLHSISHELTHYFQWVNDLKLTEIGEERQARHFSKLIVNKYAQTHLHP